VITSEIGIFAISLIITVILGFSEYRIKKEDYVFDLWRNVVLFLVLTVTIGLLGMKLATEDKLADLEEVVYRCTASSKIANSVETIEGHNNVFLTEFAKRWRVDKFAGEMKMLESGALQLTQDETFPVPTMWNELAKESICAVSYMASISDIWMSSAGDDYITSFIAAGERDVDAKRVYIFKTPEIYEEFVAEANVIQRQANALPKGTRIVFEENVVQDMKRQNYRRQASSVVVFDGVFAGEISTNPDLKPKEVHFTSQGVEVKELEKYFNNIWKIAIDPTNEEEMKLFNLAPLIPSD
jgi:hypothetical protein